jgi:hypothetical protein
LSSIKWDERGVVGRSTGVTRRLGWPEIAGFEHREGGGLGARLHDGRWVTLMPYPRSPLNKPEQAIAALEAAQRFSVLTAQTGWWLVVALAVPALVNFPVVLSS